MRNVFSKLCALLMTCLLVMGGALPSAMIAAAEDDVTVIVNDDGQVGMQSGVVSIDQVTPAPIAEESVVVDMSPSDQVTSPPAQSTNEVQTAPLPVYRVSFYDFHGNEYAWADVVQGSWVEPPPNPPDTENFAFQYWYDEVDVYATPYIFGTLVTQHINLVPRYTAKASAMTAVNNVASSTGHSMPVTESIDITTVNQILGLPDPEPVVVEAPAPDPIPESPLPDTQYVEPTVSYVDQSAALPDAKPATPDVSSVNELLGKPEAPAAPAPVQETPEAPPAAPAEVPQPTVEDLFPVTEETEQPEEIIPASPEDILNQPEENQNTDDQPAPTDNSEPVPETPAPQPEETVVVPTEETASPEQPPVTEDAQETPTPAQPETPVVDDPIPPVETPPPSDPSESIVMPQDDSQTLILEILNEMLEEEVPALPAAAPNIAIQYAIDGDEVQPGTMITLTAQLQNFPEDATDFVFQWQNNVNGTFEDVPGATGMSYSFAADSLNSGCEWRVQAMYSTAG